VTDAAGILCVVIVRRPGGEQLFNLPMRFPAVPQLKDQISFAFGGVRYFVLVEGRVFNDPGTPDENIALFCERH